jgi:hypothetical protein
LLTTDLSYSIIFSYDFYTTPLFVTVLFGAPFPGTLYSIRNDVFGSSKSLN